MYKFMTTKVCKDIRDITFICDEGDYRRLLEKPKYEGDFLKQMFDWNENQFVADAESKYVRETIISKVKDETMPETWNEFEKVLIEIKYDSKHQAR